MMTLHYAGDHRAPVWTKYTVTRGQQLGLQTYTAYGFDHRSRYCSRGTGRHYESTCRNGNNCYASDFSVRGGALW